MEILFFEVWRGSTKVKETRYAGPLTAENALGALQAENPLYRGKLTVKDGDVGLTGPHSLDSSRTYVLQLADLAGRNPCMTASFLANEASTSFRDLSQAQVCCMKKLGR